MFPMFPRAQRFGFSKLYIRFWQPAFVLQHIKIKFGVAMVCKFHF